MRTLTTLTFVFLANFSALLLAQNGSWSSLGLGLDGPCYSIAMDSDGNVYVGGDFNLATTSLGFYAEAHYIARWDGEAWYALGMGLDGPVSDMVVDEEAGYLYVTGVFTTAYNGNGTFWTVNGIARWNLNLLKWEPLGNGLGGTPNIGHALSIGPDNKIYVGGEFTQAGGLTANYIAAWDGNSWSNLGIGLNDPVYDLNLSPDGKLYVGGHFNLAGGVQARSIAIWDGTNWSPLSEPQPLTDNSEVFTLAVDGQNNLFVSGHLYLIGQIYSKNIAMWDGSQWNDLGTGLNSICYKIAIDQQNNRVYVGGKFTDVNGSNLNSLLRIAYWDGNNWNGLQNGLGSPDDISYCSAIFIAPSGEVYAGGYFFTAGGHPAYYIAKWTPQTVSTSETQTSTWKLELSPQPASDRLHVQIDKSNESVQLLVFDLQGQKLQEYSMPQNSTNFDLPLNGLNPGMYVLQVVTSTETLSQCFVKQ